MEEKFINFLQEMEIYNEKFLNYLKDKTLIVDLNEETKSSIGTYPKIDENNILKDIHICVPKKTNDITISMNIHEYVEALLLFRNLNEEYKEEKQKDLMPTFYELVYLKENNQDDYFNIYLEQIKESNSYLTILLNLFDKENVKEKNN